jgi:putative ABC transport system ATP-binding protein
VNAVPDHAHGHKKLLSPLYDLLTSERETIITILAFGIGVGLMSLVVPVGVQTVVNTVAFSQFGQPVLFLTAVIFGALALGAVFRLLQVVTVERLHKRLFAYMALELAHRLPRLRPCAGVERPAELVNRFFDVFTIQKSSSTLILEGFALALQAAVGLILLAFYHPFLLAFDILLLVAIAFIFFVLGRGATKSAVAESAEKYRVVGWLEEIASKDTAFSYGSSRMMALQRADELVNGYLSARSRHFSIVLRQVTGLLLLQAVASALLLGLGVWLISIDQLSLGQLVAAEIIVSNVLYSLVRFQKHLEAYYDLIAAVNKVSSLIDLPIEDQGRTFRVNKFEGAKLQFEEVFYEWKDQRGVLGPFDFNISSGERVTLEGPNGSGKTTIIDFLFGIRQPSEGHILFDGEDIRNVSPENLRKRASLVRGIQIVSDTVLNNVLMGSTTIFEADAIEALKAVGLWDDVLKLPEGVETVLTEAGGPLSVSHRQLLMFARAIARRPSLLLVDEALDGLDKESLDKVLQCLLDPNSSWTLIITSTRQMDKPWTNRVIRLNPAWPRRIA